VKSLSLSANAYISVHQYQPLSGNAGMNFDIELINRLSNLNLGIDIYTYIVGEGLKDDN